MTSAAQDTLPTGLFLGWGWGLPVTSAPWTRTPSGLIVHVPADRVSCRATSLTVSAEIRWSRTWYLQSER